MSDYSTFSDSALSHSVQCGQGGLGKLPGRIFEPGTAAPRGQDPGLPGAAGTVALSLLAPGS